MTYSQLCDKTHNFFAGPRTGRWSFIALSVLLLTVALLTRLSLLDQLPRGFNQDEAVIGYDAYALHLTGKNHHGQWMPLMFASFHDWTSPILNYLTVPFVALFGLSIWSVRLPVALLGVVTIIAFFFTVKEFLNSKWWGLLGAALLTCSAWQFFFSRWALQVNVGVFCTVLLFFFIMKLAKGSTSRIVVTGTVLAASGLTLSYAVHKLLAPLFLIVSLVLIWKCRPQLRKTAGVIAVGYAILSGYFLWVNYTQPEIYNVRFDGISIFNTATPVTRFIQNYLQYFSLPFLFGGEGKFTDEQMVGAPIFTPILILPLIVGIVTLVKKATQKVEKNNLSSVILAALLLFWIMLSPLSATLTTSQFHLIRTLHLFPLLLVVIVVGLKEIHEFIQNHHSWLGGTLVITGILLFSTLYFGRYLSLYATRYQDRISGYFNVGLAEVISLVKTEQRCTSWLIHNRINQPYIYYLFFTQRQPDQSLYDALHKPSADSTLPIVTQLDNITFGPVSSPQLRGKTLLMKRGLAGESFSVYISDDQQCILTRELL